MSHRAPDAQRVRAEDVTANSKGFAPAKQQHSSLAGAPGESITGHANNALQLLLILDDKYSVYEDERALLRSIERRLRAIVVLAAEPPVSLELEEMHCPAVDRHMHARARELRADRADRNAGSVVLRLRGPSNFEVIARPSNESHGIYDTLDEARGCVAFDRLSDFEIWQGDHIVLEG